MWSNFAVSSAFLFLVMMIPGFAFSRLVGLRRLDSFLAAPLFSLALLEIVSIAFSKLGISSSWTSVCIACLLMFVVFGAIAFFRKGDRKAQGAEVRDRIWDLILVLYCVVAIIAATRMYLLPLDGPSSFVQDSDNSFHLAVIRSFVDTGDYSTLNVGLYQDMQLDSIVSASSGFYPAAWHMLAALVLSFSGQDVAFAANVTNYVMLLAAFPFSMLFFLKTVFPNKKGIVAAGTAVLFAFNGFPWGTLISVSGPLFPNTLGLMLMPACAALFILTVGADKNKTARLLLFSAFLVGVFALGAAHPNSIFAMVVLLAPFVVYRFSKWFVSKKEEKLATGRTSFGVAIASFVIPVMAIVIIWTVCFLSPVFKGATSFTWAPTASHLQAVVNAVALSYRLPAGNYILAVLVAVGFFALLREKENAWLAFSYMFAVAIYIIGSSTTGFLQHFFAGFWYTDPYRLGACACLVAIPIAAVGFEVFWSLVLRLFNKLAYARWAKYVAGSVCFAVVVCGLYLYDFNLPGFGKVYTGLGDYNNCAVLSNDTKRDNLFDSNEQKFCQSVSDILDRQDGLIYNNADDGSAFAYPLYDLNLLYRRSAAEMLGSETDDNMTLRLSIDELATNKDVQRILEENNIKYILNLDLGGEVNEERCYYGYYVWDKWPGINSIDDSTPGLKVVLSEGDMRLYEIDYASFS